MKSKESISVLFLQDNTAVCCYCGNKLNVEHKSEWDEYDLYEWDEYECNCKDWNNSIILDKELNELNNNIYKTFVKYQKEFIEKLQHSNLKCSVKIYELKSGR